MAAEPVSIIGMGASTPIGRSVWASAAAARAGVAGFLEHPSMIDTAGEPMRVAGAPWLNLSLQGSARFCELLLPAIQEALDSCSDPAAFDEARIGLAVALPPSRPGLPDGLAPAIVERIEERFERRFSRIVAFEHGHAAGYLGLEAAMRSLAASSTDVCVVAGVDSYLTPETLEWIEACDQLHGGGELNNAWGFIPGEAAAAIVIATTRFAEAHGAESLAQVVSIGIGREANVIKTDSVCIGEGLTQAFRSALAPLARGERIQNVFCDLNGETYRADEYGFAALRTREWFREPTDFVAPADCWGDVGAAGMPLHAALAVIAHRKRYGRGPLSMVWASSEGGERGAAVIRAADPPDA